MNDARGVERELNTCEALIRRCKAVKAYGVKAGTMGLEEDERSGR